MNTENKLIDFLNPNFSESRKDFFGLKNFFEQMQERMDLARSKGKTGWYDPEKCQDQFLADECIQALLNGKFVDASNYLMMLWNRESNKDIFQKYINGFCLATKWSHPFHPTLVLRGDIENTKEDSYQYFSDPDDSSYPFPIGEELLMLEETIQNLPEWEP